MVLARTGIFAPMIVRSLVRAGERFDGRGLEESRTVEMEHVEDSLMAKMGKSRILVVFHRDTARPYPDRPHEGVVSFGVTLGNRRHDRASNLLHKVYIRERSIDLESLCVRQGREVVSIHMDLRVLSSDEGIYSLAVAGVNSALEMLGVSLNFVPQCFFYCSIEDVILNDPSEQELDESDWSCVVVTKSWKEILFLEKQGRGCSVEDLLEVVERSLRRSTPSRHIGCVDGK